MPKPGQVKNVNIFNYDCKIFFVPLFRYVFFRSFVLSFRISQPRETMYPKSTSTKKVAHTFVQFFKERKKDKGEREKQSMRETDVW
jgi:hypothetical protein